LKWRVAQVISEAVTWGNDLLEKIDHCHKNRVMRGLVDRVEAWRWSSYRYYELDDVSVMTVDQDDSWPIVC
jgi:hypothetical protein